MTIIASPHPDVTVPQLPLPSYLFRNLHERADKPAVIDGPSGRTLTFAQLYGASAKLAGGLIERDFGKGDVLALLAPNIPEYAVVFHGTLMAGGTVTTINPTYTAEEIHDQLRDSRARILVTIGLFLDNARAAIQGTNVSEIVVIGEGEGATPLTAYLAADPVSEHAAVDVDTDVAVLPYSSGTTGRSKGVMLTHANLTANLVQAEMSFPIDANDVVLAVLPFFHIYGMNMVMNLGLDRGLTTVTVPRFDLEQFLGLMQEHKITVTFLVPPIVLALAKHPIVEKYDLSSLRLITSGAAPLGEDTASECAARVGCDIIQGYGLTESSPLTHVSAVGSPKVGAIGPAVPNTECRIVSPETGDDLPAGKDGELWVRGPQVMTGYLNNPGATAATLTEDGWLRTGDIARVDPDGEFWIVDRLKELIKVKGFQVAPAELEELLLSHPSIVDAAVIGVPDTEAGERPKAFVVTKPGGELTEEDVRAHVRAHVATYKQVHDVVFTDEIPKSASGKILRRLLKEQ